MATIPWISHETQEEQQGGEVTISVFTNNIQHNTDLKLILAFFYFRSNWYHLSINWSLSHSILLQGITILLGNVSSFLEGLR